MKRIGYLNTSPSIMQRLHEKFFFKSQNPELNSSIILFSIVNMLSENNGTAASLSYPFRTITRVKKIT